MFGRVLKTIWVIFGHFRERFIPSSKKSSSSLHKNLFTFTKDIIKQKLHFSSSIICFIQALLLEGALVLEGKLIKEQGQNVTLQS